MFDSHCHLDRDAFASDRDDALARARAAGVSDILVPAVDPGGWEGLLAWTSGRPGVHAALGIHPQALPYLDPAGDERRLADLEGALSRGGSVAVGECGLDGPTAAPSAGEAGPHPAPMERQLAVLAGHLSIARRLRLPVVLHSLRAADPMRATLERDGVPEGGVLHSFSGSADQVPALAALGLHFSFGGPVTYEGARKPLAAARAVPRERLLVETDAPDQTPRPHRGRNEPAYLPLVVEALARALEAPVAEVAELTAANARRLFRLAPR